MSLAQVINSCLIVVCICSTAAWTAAQSSPPEQSTPQNVRIASKRDTLYEFSQDLYGDFDSRSNIFTFQVSRLLNPRFPSLTLTYQRLLGDYLGVAASIGAPINTKSVYQQSNGIFSGVDAALGVRFFLSDQRESRFFAAIDAHLYHNSIEPEAYVRNVGKPTFTVRDLPLVRKREILTVSMGYQLISMGGFTMDTRIGLGRGRIGLYSEDEVEFLTVGRRDLFTSEIQANTWQYYNGIHFGLGIGYAF